MNWRVIAAGAGFVALLAAGLLFQEEIFWMRVLTFGLLLSAVAQSWNLLAGYAGQWSLAQLAFFGVGAYAVGILEIEFGIPLLVGLVPAMLITSLFAAGLGYITLRIRGHYFSLVTFFLTVSLFELVRYFADYTGGQFGLNISYQPGIDILMLQFEDQVWYYYLAVAVAVLASVCLWFVVRSRFGLLLRAIRDDQDSAAALGVPVLALKVAAMSISAAMASLAGVAYLATYKLMDAETAFGIHNSLDPIVGGILGGAGTILGGVVGELILQPVIAQVNVVFGAVPGMAAMLYGAILMLVILLIPKGLLGLIKPAGPTRRSKSNNWWFRRTAPGAPAVATQPDNDAAAASHKAEVRTNER